MPKVIGKNQNKLTIFLDRELNSLTQPPNTTTTTTSTSTTPSPPSTTSNNSPAPSRTSKKRKQNPPTDNIQQNNTTNNTPAPPTPSPSIDKTPLYKQKRELCIFCQHSTKIGRILLKTKDKEYIDTITLTKVDAEDSKLKQVVIKSGSKVKVFGSDEVWLVAGISRPLCTLYLLTAVNHQIKKYSQLDLTGKEEGEATTQEQAVVEEFWEKVKKEEGDKTEKTSATKVIKKET